MPVPNLSSCIIQSLRAREMVSPLPDALLAHNRTALLRHDETEYWDYKEQISWDSPLEVARIAKDVLGFHNAKGGMIIVGVDKAFKAHGIQIGRMFDSNDLNAKLRRYIGSAFLLFQDRIVLPNGRALWLLFIPPRSGFPVAVASNGPDNDTGRPEVLRNQYFLRVGDQTRSCVEPRDLDRLFGGFTLAHLQAYLYDVDEPYFRLLAPDCDQFVGRTQLLEQLTDAINSRHPIVALDGTGGVGKTATAIHLVRHLFDARQYLFVVSLTAKSRVWQGFAASRQAGFAGLTEFLHECAKVLQLQPVDDVAALKQRVIAEMDGNQGLLLVDNIEDVQDSGVLHFLSREVPAPVKVLVTSRVDRGLGALTIGVPEMDEREARELLFHELERAGYAGFMNEQQHIDDILRVAGRVPLALKWAAGLAASTGSLKEASGRLRKTDATKREFLNFCFSTMYDALSPLARETGLLCWYLGDQWSVPAVAVALDASESEVKGAFNELKDRGIILPSTTAADGAMRLLPLTFDFLGSKWNENDALRRRVDSRLADAIGSTEHEGVLLNWPRQKRVEVLQRRAEQLRKSKEFNAAEKLIHLAIASEPSASLRFLEGKIRYESGHKSEGLALMRVAMAQGQKGELGQADQIYLAQALLAHGGNEDEHEALLLFEDAIPTADAISTELIDVYCKLALGHREYSSVLRVIDRTVKEQRLKMLITSLEPSVEDSMFLHWCGQSLVSALRRLGTSSAVAESEAPGFELLARRIEGLLASSSR